MLFERVETLEDHCVRLANGTPDGTPMAEGRAKTVDMRMRGSDLYTSTRQPDTASTAPPKSPADRVTPGQSMTRCPAAVSKTTEHAELVLRQSNPWQVYTIFEASLNQIHLIKRQRALRVSTRLDADIPPHVAKACLQNIVDVPGIQIQPALLTLCYSMLYHGSLVTSVGKAVHNKNVSLSIHSRCLRDLPVWKEQFNGSKTDILAGTLVMQISFQQFDCGLGWDIFRLMCHIAKAQRLHQIDRPRSGSPASDCPPPDGADQSRILLWDLAYKDLFFRLIHDQCPVLTSELREWHVDLPGLGTSSDRTEQALPLLVNFIKSRMTFILLSYFECLEAWQPEEDLSDRVVDCCTQLEQLLRDWSVADLMTAHQDSVSYWWLLYDLMLTGYCSIVFIVRRTDAVGPQSLWRLTLDKRAVLTNLAVDASRQILQMVQLSLHKYPHPATVSTAFAAFRCHFACHYLAKSASLSAVQEDGSFATNDVGLLEGLYQSVMGVAKMDEDLMHIATSLGTLIECTHATRKGPKEANVVPTAFSASASSASF